MMILDLRDNNEDLQSFNLLIKLALIIMVIATALYFLTSHLDKPMDIGITNTEFTAYLQDNLEEYSLSGRLCSMSTYEKQDKRYEHYILADKRTSIQLVSNKNNYVHNVLYISYIQNDKQAISSMAYTETFIKASVKNHITHKELYDIMSDIDSNHSGKVLIGKNICEYTVETGSYGKYIIISIHNINDNSAYIPEIKSRL